MQNHAKHGAPGRARVQLPKKSGEETIWFMMFMVDIRNWLMEVFSWFINQQTYLGGPILYQLVQDFFHRMYSWVSIHLSWGCSINLSGYITIILPSGKLT